MFNLSCITDEISNSLIDAIKFCKKYGLRYVDLRTIDNVNLMNMEDNDLITVYQQLRDSSVEVLCYASPLLKWGDSSYKNIELNSNFHSYYHDSQIDYDGLYHKAIYIAYNLGAKYIRVFSLLKSDNYNSNYLVKELSKICSLAHKYEVKVVIENEPICNLSSLQDLHEFFSKFEIENLYALLDFGNVHQSRELYSLSNVENLLPYTKMIHLKDYDALNGKYVYLGAGDVDYKSIIDLIRKLRYSIDLSLETHVLVDKQQAVARSIKRLKSYINDK